MTSRDLADERYNRRTRALERQANAQAAQADALDRIATAFELHALTSAAQTTVLQVNGSTRSWTSAYAEQLLNHVGEAVKRVTR